MERTSNFGLILFFALASLCLFPLARRWRLFNLPTSKDIAGRPSLSFVTMLIAIFSYIGVLAGSQLVVVHFFSTVFLREELIAVAFLFGTICSAIVLIGISCFTQNLRLKIWGDRPATRAFLRGVLVSIVIYPMVMLLVEVVHLVVSEISHVPFPEQSVFVLLKQLRLTLGVMFYVFLFAVITLIPFLEELLFRGFIQNWLVDRFGIAIGVVVASLVFAAVHYAGSQGMTNIELVVGLTALSMLIGSQYIKERSLFANIGLHAGFNAIGLLEFIILY